MKSSLLRILPLGLLLFAAAPALCADNVNVDELEHKFIKLPNGATVEIVVYNGHNWRLVDPAILLGNDDSDPDVCFETKFDVLEKDHIKLFGQKGVIVLEDRSKLKALNELKRMDNVMLFGTLGKVGGKLELRLVESLKIDPDLQRYDKLIAVMEKQAEADITAEARKNIGERIVEMGHKIEQQRKQVMNIGIADFEKLGSLRDKAFKKGLTIKEGALRRDDADAVFDLALQWRELLRNNAKFRELVRRCLQIDPDHPKASRIAESEMGLFKFENSKWLEKAEVEKILQQRKLDQERLDTAQKAALEQKARELADAIKARPQLLIESQAAIRTDDAKGRQGAIASLGEAIWKTPDVGFGEEAVNILAGISDPAAIAPGLETAAKSEIPEIRREVLEALVWRGRQKDKSALAVLERVLKAEKDSSTARAGVDALAAMGGRSAASTLVASLGAPDNGVRDEIIEGLKAVVRQPINSKEGWEDWWSKNKDSYNPPE